MSENINGVQQSPKFGGNLDIQYGINSGDNNLTNQTTLPDNPLYNLSKIVFQGMELFNINKNLGDVGPISSNGLKTNPTNVENHKLFTSV